MATLLFVTPQVRAQTVNVTNPTAGQTFIAPATLNLSATATDSAANITQVAYYNGTALLGTATQAPYNLTVPGLSVGTYSITAQLTDSAASTATSSPVSVSVQPVSSPSTWVSHAIPSNTWNQLAYGNGTYVTLSWTNSNGAYSKNGGVTWTQTSLPIFTDWVGVAYGNGLFVAPAYGAGVAITSPDGITWTTATLPAAEGWDAITFGNGIFVTAGNSTTGAMSTDGIHWAATTMPASSWTGITYGNGRFVAVASGTNVAATSTDGITWTKQTLPVSAAWQAIAYGSNEFVAIAQASNIVATSPDGVNWTQATMPVSAAWNSIAYGEGMFVAVAGQNTAGTSTADTIAATSPDGIHWSSNTLPASGTWSGILFANNQFVAVAQSGNAATMQVTSNIAPPTVTMTGPSSGTWSQAGAIPLTATASSNGAITQVQFFNGSTLLGTATQSPYTYNWNTTIGGACSITAVATDNVGQTTRSSPLAFTIASPITVSLTSPTAGQVLYTPATLNLSATAKDSAASITQVAYYNGSALLGTTTQAPYSLTIPNFGAVGTYNITAQATDSAGSIANSSPASVNIQPVSSPGAWVSHAIPSNTWNQLAYGNGTYVTLSWTNSNGAYSKNGGVTWTQTSLPSFQDWIGITYGNGLFVAPAYGSNVVITSSDGITWTASTLPAAEGWESMTYGNGIFVAAGNSTTGAMSTDGIHWTATTMPGSNWTGITYANGRFVAVSTGGTLAATSTDGINWTKQTLPASASWQAITYGNSEFVAIAQGSNTVAISPDGVAWSLATMPQAAAWNSVAFGDGLFVAIAGQYTAGTSTAGTIAATSPDGTHWTANTLSTSGTWSGIVFANNQFVAVAQSGAVITLPVIPNVAPPTITLTGPSSGTWSQAGAIPLTATVPSNGAIAQVQFFNGSTLLGTVTQSPYTFNWNNAPAGSYSMTAVVTDFAGQTASSSPINLTVILPPTISLTSPTTGQTFAAPASLNLSATATDSGANITQVAFYNGSTLLGVATTSPYTLNWTNVAYGTYSITAVASNSAGVSTTSAPVTVTVNLLPVIALTSPSVSQTLTAPAKLTLTATASTAGGTITQVGFFNGTTLMSALTQAPYTVTLPDLEPGTYVISAQATNSAGFSAATNPITVTVTAGSGSSGGGTPVGGVQQVYDIQTDQLNTPRLITDSSGNAVWQWDNTEPFGNSVPNQSPNGGSSLQFNLRFPGQYADVETGTVYNYFRDYDPATGRYIESDPIGLMGGINTYGYVGGNPAGFSDPKGQCFACEVVVVGGIIYYWWRTHPVTLPSNDSVPDDLLSGPMETRQSGKEKSDQYPSWVDSQNYPKGPNENCRQYAERVLKEKYGCDDPRANKRGPGSEYNQIEKACRRGGLSL